MDYAANRFPNELPPDDQVPEGEGLEEYGDQDLGNTELVSGDSVPKQEDNILTAANNAQELGDTLGSVAVHAFTQEDDPYLQNDSDPLLSSVITDQPTGKNTDEPRFASGLGYLRMVDQLFVYQEVEPLEIFSGLEINNKYSIKNVLGQRIYVAGEESKSCMRNCCAPRRPFNMKIFDISDQQVINLHRPFACDSCCCPCCLQTMEVSAPPGTLIGTVEQQWSMFYTKFAIKNPAGETVLRIEGPFNTSSCCGQNVEFKVLSADGKREIGMILKKWSGLAQETIMDADNFGVSFPKTLDVTMKATLLGACFLIDMMYFEGYCANATNPENTS